MKKIFYFAAPMLFVGVSLPLAHATKAHPTNVVSTRPNEDEDNDGLTNQEEAEFDTFPYNAYSDADSVMDGEDGWALNPNFSPPRIPTTQYAVVQIDLGGDTPVAINNSAQVAATSSNWTASFWEKGEKTALPVPPTSDTSGIRPVGINDSGVVLCNGWTYGNGPSEDPQGSRSYSGVWQKGGALTELYSFFGTEGTERVRAGSFAVSLNDVGQVVGNAEGGTIHYDDQGVPSYNENLHYPSALWSTAGGSPAHLLPDDQSRTVSGQAINNHGVSVVARYANGLGLLSVVEGGAETPLGEGYPNYINDGNMIVGWRGNQPAIWYKKDGNGQWLSEAIDVRGRINNQYQIIDSTGFKSVVWQNAKSYLLSNLGPSRAGWSEYINAVDINDHGIILASSFRVRDADGNPVSPSGWVPILLIPCDIVPNFDRNETIDLIGGKDRSRVTESKPWRWWINDDSDNGDIANGDSDVPGALAGWFEWDGRTPNHSDTKVNGCCDLVDFFPLFFDIKQLLEVLPPSSAQYKLKHEDGAFGFVYTDLTPAQADDFCIEDATTGYGPSFTQPAKDATVTKVTSSGVVLSTEFLNKIKDNEKGVLLFEASMATDKPLILEITKDGQKLSEVKFFIKASEIEKMYRWANLRGVQGVSGSVTRSTNLQEPENYPDQLTNNKNFVLVHGYSVREQQARGWNAETFKRLHQLGSKAKFVAVAWRGDEGKMSDWIPWLGGATPDYYENVINAFLTAPHLAGVVNGLSGDKYVAAHSLGNMVATSAIKDHGMSVNKYLMIDAAVAMEAYDASLESDAGMRNRMRHPDWQNYFDASNPTNPRRVWSTEWYKLFGSSDGRNKLTWRGRFGNIGNAINFYSSTEDVLQNNPDGQVPGVDFNQGTLAWTKQEMEKGSPLIALATWDSHGGWGFNSAWDDIIAYDPNTGLPITERKTPSEANALTDDQLRADSFFKRFSDSRLYNASQGSGAAGEYNTRSKMLGEALPSLSYATGANSLAPFGAARNVDMMGMKTGSWPRGNGEWRHSDFREVAFYFTQQLYQRFVTEGELKK